jgi:sulfatase maturation enzyme AslB (radical SAM superfamily)
VTALSVQWQIGNECNLKCDYCHPTLYGGSNPFLTNEQFESGFKNLDSSVALYDSIEIEFQGGEPTISESIRNKIANPDAKYKYRLTSNSTASINWWQQSAPNFNHVTLAYHPDVDVEHYKTVAEIISQTVPDYYLLIHAHNDADKFQKAQELFESFKARNLAVGFKALYSNYQKGNDKFLSYNTEQWNYYLEVNNLHAPPVEGTEAQIQWVEERLHDNYKGHLCWAGVEQIVVDYFGFIYRGWCHAHGSLGNIFEKSVELDEKPRVCPYTICKNPFDKQARKSQNSWGIS